MKITKLLFPFIALFCLSSCSYQDHSQTFYTSIYPLYEFTSRIVLDKYEVENLIPFGKEPHDFELSAKQVEGLHQGKGLIVNGFGMEHWLNDLPKSIQEKQLIASDSIKKEYINGQLDPHTWLNPQNAILQAQKIMTFVSKNDVVNRLSFEANFTNLKKELEQLDDELWQLSQTFSQKTILVSHAAYGYMCSRYGLKQIYVNGIEANQEPSAKALNEIKEQVNNLGITTIFTEEFISSKISDKIASECHIKVETLNPLESLNKEQMDTENYFSIMRKNFQKIAEACK